MNILKQSVKQFDGKYSFQSPVPIKTPQISISTAEMVLVLETV
jgi:hypothetical protein